MTRGGTRYFPHMRTREIAQILTDARRPRTAREIREQMMERNGDGWVGGMTCNEIAGHIKRHMGGRVSSRKVGKSLEYTLVRS